MSDVSWQADIPKNTKVRKRKFPFFSLLLLLFLLSVIACFSNNFIPSESMEPTLAVGDHVLTMRQWIAFPGGKMPARGDIIIFRMPLFSTSSDEDKSASSSDDDGETKSIAAQIKEKLIERQKKGDLLIKRVIGLPGETVIVKGNTVFINGKKLQEDYKTIPSLNGYAEFATEQKPLKVPEGEIFVLGDNRSVSDDGRFQRAGNQSRGGNSWVSEATGRYAASGSRQ